MFFFENASEDLFALDIIAVTFVAALVDTRLAALVVAAALLLWAFHRKN